MSYHLNIFHAKNQDYKFSLSEVLSILQLVDQSASVIDSQSNAKEFSVSKPDVGKLYFSNGMFWSIYESDDQLERLVNFLEPLELIVVGEEGEFYNANANVGEALTQGTLTTKDKKTNFKNFFNRRKIGFFIVFLFIVFAWVIN